MATRAERRPRAPTGTAAMRRRAEKGRREHASQMLTERGRRALLAPGTAVGPALPQVGPALCATVGPAPPPSATFWGAAARPPPCLAADTPPRAHPSRRADRRRFGGRCGGARSASQSARAWGDTPPPCGGASAALTAAQGCAERPPRAALRWRSAPRAPNLGAHRIFFPNLTANQPLTTPPLVAFVPQEVAELLMHTQAQTDKARWP